MAIYLRIDDKKDYDWLVKVISNWLGTNPNDPRLQLNYEFIAAWDKYLSDNVVNLSEVIKETPEDKLLDVIAKTDLKKVKVKSKPPEPEVTQPKRRGRPPKKETIAAQKHKEQLLRQKEREQKKKDLESDPFRCAEHPTYGGKNRLNRECTKCWDIYKKFHPAEYKTARAAFERNQRKQEKNL